MHLMQTPGLSVIPLRNPSINRNIGIIYKAGRQLSPAASDLIRLLQTEMRAAKLQAP